MAKIVLIGAGSYVFGRDFISDIIQYPQLGKSTLTLMDIDAERLEIAAAYARKLVAQNKLNLKIESTTDRRKALDSADYVITSIRAGGWKPVQINRELAWKRGVECVPDALGPGGIFGGLRQVPAILEICHDMEELCPDAWLLNYCNPMAIICWAINDYTKIKNVGLCPNHHNLAVPIARYAGIPFDELYYTEAGINHFGWYLELKWRGKDLYPLLKEKFKDPDVYLKADSPMAPVDLIEVEVFQNFGYFNSGGGHLSMYLPYFRRTPQLTKKYKQASQGSIWDQAPIKTKKDDKKIKEQIKAGYQFPINREYRWSIHATNIINSIETGSSTRSFGNVKNNGLITNLLQGCVVEVPCMVDKGGVHPCQVGDLPPQLAALDSSNVFVQEMAVRGIVEKDKSKILQSILLDPLTSSILSIPEIKQMVEEMFRAEKAFMKGYK